MLFVPHAWPPSLEEDVFGPLRDLPDAERVAPEFLYPRCAPAFSTLPSNNRRIQVNPDGGLPAYAQLYPLLPPPRSIRRYRSARWPSQRGGDALDLPSPRRGPRCRSGFKVAVHLVRKSWSPSNAAESSWKWEASDPRGTALRELFRFSEVACRDVQSRV